MIIRAIARAFPFKLRERGEPGAHCANPETGWEGLTGEPDGGYLGVTGEQARPERQPHLDNPATPALIHGPGSASRRW